MAVRLRISATQFVVLAALAGVIGGVSYDLVRRFFPPSLTR